MARVLPLLLLLLGGRPSGELVLSDGAVWYPVPGGGPEAPQVRAPCPGEESGWSFSFPTTGGYVETPVDGDRLGAAGFHTLAVRCRSAPGATPLNLVFGTGRGAFRAPLPEGDGSRRRLEIPMERFQPDPGVAGPLRAGSLRYLRFETPPGGPSRESVLDVSSVRFRCDGNRAFAPAPGPRPTRDFALGVFLLGGNRTLLGPLALAGANVVVEYGPNTWPRAALEDYLDYAHGVGVQVAPSLTRETRGRILPADARLAPLSDHPALLAWYLFDEPDGAVHRGLRADHATPEALRVRSRALDSASTLVTCLDAPGVARYVQTADLIAADYYLPAYAPGRSLGKVHADAEAVAEIAAASGALPLHSLQLAHEDWDDPELRQTPASLRAQSYGALGAGMRGLLYFYAAHPVRALDRGLKEGDIWTAFCELAGELATVGPLAGGWTRVPGEPRLGDVLGETRASCFRDGETSWIVLVNLGTRRERVELAGDCLREAVRLRDAHAEWSAPVRRGAWKGFLEPLEARLLRVENAARDPRAPAVFRCFPDTTGSSPLRYDTAVVGATLFPAPEDSLRLFLDGADLTPDAASRSGPAATIRFLAEGLAPGRHEAAVSWTHGDAAHEHRWTFSVDALRASFADDFERETLGRDWSRLDDTIWNTFDEEETPARGTIRIVDGELRVRSTGGGLGAMIRRFEAPQVLRVRFRARLERPGTILLQRNEVFQEVALDAGTYRVELREDADARIVLVDGVERTRWSPSIIHRGGALALGVAHGSEAFFDDVEAGAP